MLSVQDRRAWRSVRARRAVGSRVFCNCDLNKYSYGYILSFLCFVSLVPFVDRPYSAPSYNAYYRYYQPSHYPPHGGAPPRYRVSAQPSEVRYAAGQSFATRYYANREQEAAQRQQEQFYRRSRPNDSFLHEYQYGVGSSQDHPFPETRVRQSRSIPENGYHSPVDRRGRNYRSKTPDPPPRRHHVVSDDMIF